MHGRNGLVNGYLFAMGCLSCCGGNFHLGRLILRNVHPLLTVRKASIIELAFLHEVESRRRCLPTKTRYSSTGLLFRWFWLLRTRLLGGGKVWFGLWCCESMGQFNESRVWSEWSRDGFLRFEKNKLTRDALIFTLSEENAADQLLPKFALLPEELFCCGKDYRNFRILDAKR